MPDNTVPVLGPLTVWVLPATPTTGTALTADAANFPWGWGWIKEPRLSATGNRLTRRPGGMGSGSLTVLRQTRQEPGSKVALSFNSSVIAGQYVCITADKASVAPYVTDPATSITTATVLTPANILWWGWISAIDYTSFQGSSDGIGTATVLEVGHLLDQQTCTGFAREGQDLGYPAALASPPTANIGDSASYIIGNAKLIANAVGSTPGYVFAKLPEDCGTAISKIWTRWRLLQHIVAQCRPGGMPPLAVVCADGSQAPDPAAGAMPMTIASFLNDTSVPEVYDLRNLTVKGALDLCIPQSRGFNWAIELVDQTTWQVVVYSYGLGGTGALPANSSNGLISYKTVGGITADDRLVQSVRVVKDCASMPDEIWVEGSPIVWGNTVSFADGNLKEGWERGAGKQEDTYRLGAQSAAGYYSLAPDLQLERNAMVRASAGVRDVYTRFGLYSYTNGDVRVATVPGTGTGGNLPLCPQLDWDGTNVTINTFSRCPYLPTAELLRTVPWPEGVQGDGTDTRPTISKNFPQFLRPRLFRYDSANVNGRPWLDLESRSGHVGQVTMHLDVDDRGAAMRVTLASPEFLALNHWVDAAGGTTSPARSDISGEGADLASPLAIDYTKLVATIGIESDQTVRVVIQRPGITDPKQVRRRLVIREPALQCWVMRKQAIIGLLKDGTPERVTNASFPFASVASSDPNNSDAGILIRNDWPAAQKRATMAAAWVFRQRTSVRISRASPDVPPAYARLGFLILQINEPQILQGQQAAFTTVNTVVEEVTYDFSAQPKVEIATTMPQMIGFPPVGGAGGGSPSGGGSVSTSLGGTVSQAVLTQQQQTADLNREAQRVPVIIPRISPLPLPVYQVAIIGGNVLSSGQQGIKSASVTSVPSAYNPATDTSMIDGVGYGTLITNGVSTGTKVLVVNNGAGVSYNSFPLIVNDVILSSGTVSLLVGSGPTSVLAYTVG